MTVAAPIAEGGLSIAHYKAEVNTRACQGVYVLSRVPWFTAAGYPHNGVRLESGQTISSMKARVAEKGYGVPSDNHTRVLDL